MTARDALSTANKLRLWPTTLRRARLSPARMARLQLRFLRRTLRDAYTNVPLYRTKLDAAGVHPDEIRSLRDLERLPITEKDEIRSAFPQGAVRHGTDLAQCRIQQTSGSSGTCMEIALGRFCDDARTLYTQRMYGFHGFTWWRKMAYLFPYPLPLRRNLGLYRNRHVSSALEPARILAELRAFAPDLLAATPSDLLDLCSAVDPAELRALGLRAVCVHSEPMSLDERSAFAAQFGCPVATNYYCNEVWAIASECAHGVLHQFPDNVVLEITDDDGRAVPPGELGNVIVTSLHNYVQPFIRYRLGDLAAWDASGVACACGSRLPRMARIEGRDDDYLVAPNGRRIHPSKLTVAVKSPCFAHPGAQIYRDYRISQVGPAHVVVQIVPGRDREHFESCSAQGRKNLEAVLSTPFRVELEVVEKLERGSGGKRKIVERIGAGSEER
jgi:phenylacetate-CoA ligase